MRQPDVVEEEDAIVIDGVRIAKPFVEKPGARGGTPWVGWIDVLLLFNVCARARAACGGGRRETDPCMCVCVGGGEQLTPIHTTYGALISAPYANAVCARISRMFFYDCAGYSTRVVA